MVERRRRGRPPLPTWGRRRHRVRRGARGRRLRGRSADPRRPRSTAGAGDPANAGKPANGADPFSRGICGNGWWLGGGCGCGYDKGESSRDEGGLVEGEFERSNVTGTF